MRLRKSQSWGPSSPSETKDSAWLARKSIVAALRSRSKKLEEEKRDSTERLEHAYDMIAAIGLTAPRTTSG
jgi:hypothetical protein